MVRYWYRTKASECLGDLTKKDYYKNVNDWQRLVNRITAILYIEKTYDEVSQELNLSWDYTRHTLYKMQKLGLVRKVDKNGKAAYIRVLQK